MNRPYWEEQAKKANGGQDFARGMVAGLSTAPLESCPQVGVMGVHEFGALTERALDRTIPAGTLKVGDVLHIRATLSATKLDK